MSDPTWRSKYVDAIATQLGKWNVQQIQGWIDTWSQQIAADVAADPHTWASPAQFQMAVSTAHDVVAAAGAVSSDLRRLRAERYGRRPGR